MVAESRKSARARSPAKKSGARSKSPAPASKRDTEGEKTTTSKKTSAPPAAGTSGVLPVLILALVVGGMLALVNGYVPANITKMMGVETGRDGKIAVDLMGFSGNKVDAFFSSLSMILVSEVGDKTFFIAAVLAMKHSRAAVLGGALGALALMTALSAAMGEVSKRIMPHEYTHYLAVLLFVVFGIKLLKDAQEMSPEGPSEELEEVEAELSKTDKKKDPDVEVGVGGRKKEISLGLVNAVLWQAFTLTFVAEWGDRSQVSTIALAAQKNAYAVTLGGVLGHACCTSLAVVGGRMLASRISERTVTMCGGVLFLIFAVHGILQDPSSPHND